MKKKSKIILSCVLGAVVIAGGITAGVLVNNNKNMTGAIMASGEQYGWKKYDVHIDLQEGRSGTTNGEIDETKYYTNNQSYKVNDYIKNIYYRYYGEYIPTSNEAQKARSVVLTYNQYFNPSDDLLTFFVLTNGTDTYVTDIETSHGDIFDSTGEERFEFEGKLAQKLFEGKYYIKEIWVMTED